MLYSEKVPEGRYSESIRTIRTNIKYLSVDNEKKVLLVTSVSKGEGKSTTAGNLAVAFSQDEKKVLLLDCDLRKSQIHKMFELSNQIGLTDILANEIKVEEVINKYSEKVDIITSGKKVLNPCEMLSSNKFKLLLDDLREKYDYIIIDSPPLDSVADAKNLSVNADGTIIVVKSETTKKNSLLEAKKSLDKVGGKIVGVIVNRVKSKRPLYYWSLYEA